MNYPWNTKALSWGEHPPTRRLFRTLTAFYRAFPCLFVPFLCIGLLASAGCATHRVRIAAHGDSQHPISKDQKITVAPPDPAQRGGDVLYRTLLEELSLAGFQVVSQADADYMLVVFLDQNDHEISGPSPTLRGNYLRTASMHPGLGTTANYPIYSSAKYSIHSSADYPIYSSQEALSWPTMHTGSEGIRLSLYPTRVGQPAQLHSAWEGYVDSGRATVPPERQRRMVKTLLSYFGRDFVGKIRLPE
jgi:hypothetical protein